MLSINTDIMGSIPVSMKQYKFQIIVNLFDANNVYLYHLKTSKNFYFHDISKDYRKRTVP